ncbi:MAG: cysteine--tRNA ligase [Thermodesulfobacteriota bacterium]|nr:cysteine--tRNA ligase [Thermodesulfobacteriota bacterium]
MTLRLYNTLTGQKEEFKPIKKKKVGIYVCGITAYDICHVGHARSAVVFDVITKYLKYRGYNVTYVKNFTDVDDKIIEKADAEGVSISEISEKYIREHNEDMDALGVARPTVAPKATENIKGMIRHITVLLEKKLAYANEGDVYFSVEKFEKYGKLSGRNLEDMIAGSRVEVDKKKKNPLDFVLWKASKEGEPWWDSPWGRGRPGWHIECSAMSQRFLGDTFDIHGGGKDLIFPHHENEIAQSEGATGKTFATYWIHNGFVRADSEKMSKSLGNIFTIKEILKSYHPEVLRLFMLQSHYRSPVDFSSDFLDEARMGMERFYTTLKNMEDVLANDVNLSGVSAKNLSGKDKDVYKQVEALPGRFVEGMDDDFNTAMAIGCIFDTVRLINGYLAEEEVTMTTEKLFVLDVARKNIKDVGKVLGLFLEDPDEYFRKDRDKEVQKCGLNVEDIERLIEERKAARAAKDWKKADEIRDTLAGKGVTLKDTPTATTWKIG